jgi:hypothetical protein
VTRRRRSKTPRPGAPSFASEAELCASFAAFAKTRGWAVHPETSDFDLLLVWDKDFGHPQVPGDVVGVQAKMRPSLELLAQAKPNWMAATGPDFHVLVVPQTSGPFLAVTQALGLSVSTPGHYGWNLSLGKRHHYPKRPWYPAVPVEMEAGVPSPRSVTKWKMTAVRLCLHGVQRGYLTAADFGDFGISIRRWVDQGWIQDTGLKEGKLKKYRVAERAPHTMYPEVTASVAKEKT